MKRKSKAMNAALWVVQALLAATMLWAGSLKIFQSVEKTAAMWPWAGEVPAWFVRITGVVDLLGAGGLLLPGLLRIKPVLTPIAAVAIVVLMVCASVFHIARGEASQIGVNVAFAALAGLVAWGRSER